MRILGEMDGIWQLGKELPMVSHANRRPQDERERSCEEQLEHHRRMPSPWQRDQHAATRIKDTIALSKCRGFLSPVS